LQPSVNDIRSGNDVVLNKALDLARTTIKETKKD
jgi:hypothetical protein